MRAGLMQRGWALPLLCLLMVLGTMLLTAALQRTLLERARAVRLDLQQLQARALAEGGLHWALAWLQDARAIGPDCRPVRGVVGPGETFAERQARPGAVIRCRVALEAPAGAEAWSCLCPISGPAPPAPADSAPLPLPNSGLLEIAFSGNDSALQMKVSASLAASPDVPTPRAAAGARISRSSSVMLRRNPEGRWREVVGTWTDTGP